MESREVKSRIDMCLYAREQFIDLLRDNGFTIDSLAEAAFHKLGIKKATLKKKLYELQRGDGQGYFPVKDKATKGISNISTILDTLGVPEDHELIQTTRRLYTNFHYPPE